MNRGILSAVFLEDRKGNKLEEPFFHKIEIVRPTEKKDYLFEISGKVDLEILVRENEVVLFYGDNKIILTENRESIKREYKNNERKYRVSERNYRDLGKYNRKWYQQYESIKYVIV